MADEAINTDALAAANTAAIQAAVKAEFNAARQEAQRQAQENAQRRAQQQAVNQVAQDPLAQTLRPYIEPVARSLNLKADNALDAVHFYNENPSASQHRVEIENIVNTMAAQGQAFDRDTAYKFLKGAKFDQFVDAEIKERERKTNEAQQQGFAVGAAGVGGPHVGRLVGLGPNSKLEDLETALAGVAF